jgi:hypothetical protein
MLPPKKRSMRYRLSSAQAAGLRQMLSTTFDGRAEAFEREPVPARDGRDNQALAALSRGLRVLSAEQVRGIKIL